MTDDNGRSARKARPAPPDEAPEPERIAKAIARAGLASRRDAEAMIAEGRVTLNGEVLTSPAVNVTPADRITVDGEPLPARERTRLWLFHKPRGVVTTARDPEGRQTVFDILPEDLPRVVAIGRLDINTEGLLLLTNDGGLAKVIASPETGWLRRYRVRAHGEVTQEQLDGLRKGVTVDEMEYGPIEATLDRMQGDNVWLTLGLREGKNREVKRVLEHLGLQVNRLIRLSFGPFQLGDLEQGLVEEVRTRVLKDQLGNSLAEAAGVDFESPVREPIAPFAQETRVKDARGKEARAGKDAAGGRERARERPDDRPRREGARRPPAPPERGFERWEERRPAAPVVKRSVWRADQDEARPARRPPRRDRDGDPREARAAAGARPRERARPIEGPEGRKVRVERLVSDRSADEERPVPRRRARGDEGRRPAPRADDRPRRRAPAEGEAPRERPPRRERPPGPSGDGPRRFGRPGRGTPSGDRPGRGERPPGPGRGGPSRGRPSRPGGPGGAPRGAGPPRGPKGPPRGRR